MQGLFKCISGEVSHFISIFIAAIHKLPDFMLGNLLELLGVLLASVGVAVVTTLTIDKKRVVQKVKARVLDLRLEQYDAIRLFVENQSRIVAFPEDIDAVKRYLGISSLSLKDNENYYSSKGIASEKKIQQSLAELENLTINGLYILDDDVLGLLLQIKIYLVNLIMFSSILHGYYDSGNQREDKDVTYDDLIRISDIYFHYLSIFLYNEFQNMIVRLRDMVVRKASKPKFERKDKDYRQIKTRRRLQGEALDKTILKNQFPQLLMLLASLCSDYFEETNEQRDNTIKGFYTFALDILGWQEGS